MIEFLLMAGLTLLAPTMGQASVIIPITCFVKAEVVKDEMASGTQNIAIKILSKEDIGYQNCPSGEMQVGSVYESSIPPYYRGKFLYVAPVKPGQLSLGDIILLKTTFAEPPYHTSYAWEVQENDKGIPVGASFLTDVKK